jgi:hypothetical protein
MALKKIIDTEGLVTVSTPFGEIKNGTKSVSFLAYAKVIQITGNKTQLTATVSFSGESNQFVQQYQVPVSVANGAPNFIAQVYEHLKTLPEFAGATDC